MNRTRARLTHGAPAIREARQFARDAGRAAAPGAFRGCRECRAEDEPSAQLLEAYLDRLMPGWREAAEPPGGAARDDGGRRTAAAEAMTLDEAYEILDLAPGADAAAIKEAHRRLMMKLHPDHGGSTWLAAKINRAKELLLK